MTFTNSNNNLFKISVKWFVVLFVKSRPMHIDTLKQEIVELQIQSTIKWIN